MRPDWKRIVDCPTCIHFAHILPPQRASAHTINHTSVLRSLFIAISRHRLSDNKFRMYFISHIFPVFYYKFFLSWRASVLCFVFGFSYCFSLILGAEIIGKGSRLARLDQQSFSRTTTGREDAARFAQVPLSCRIMYHINKSDSQ